MTTSVSHFTLLKFSAALLLSMASAMNDDGVLSPPEKPKADADAAEPRGLNSEEAGRMAEEISREFSEFPLQENRSEIIDLDPADDVDDADDGHGKWFRNGLLAVSKTVLVGDETRIVHDLADVTFIAANHVVTTPSDIHHPEIEVFLSQALPFGGKGEPEAGNWNFCCDVECATLKSADKVCDPILLLVFFSYSSNHFKHTTQTGTSRVGKATLDPMRRKLNTFLGASTDKFLARGLGSTPSVQLRTLVKHSSGRVATVFLESEIGKGIYYDAAKMLYFQGHARVFANSRLCKKCGKCDGPDNENCNAAKNNGAKIGHLLSLSGGWRDLRGSCSVTKHGDHGEGLRRAWNHGGGYNPDGTAYSRGSFGANMGWEEDNSTGENLVNVAKGWYPGKALYNGLRSTAKGVANLTGLRVKSAKSADKPCDVFKSGPVDSSDGGAAVVWGVWDQNMLKRNAVVTDPQCIPLVTPMSSTTDASTAQLFYARHLQMNFHKLETVDTMDGFKPFPADDTPTPFCPGPEIGNERKDLESTILSSQWFFSRGPDSAGSNVPTPGSLMFSVGSVSSTSGLVVSQSVSQSISQSVSQSVSPFFNVCAFCVYLVVNQALIHESITLDGPSLRTLRSPEKVRIR